MKVEQNLHSDIVNLKMNTIGSDLPLIWILLYNSYNKKYGYHLMNLLCIVSPIKDFIGKLIFYS